jgi:N6-adenosine-specific RNA methylase IME4
MVTLPAGPFGAVLADPPWRFRTWSETNQAKSASRHYQLMEMADMEAMPVAEVAADDCVLLMWAVNPMLPQALRLIDAWGFKLKTVAFTWAKRSPRNTSWHVGLGYWTRQNTEQCLLATRGKPKRKPTATSVQQLLVSPRREHSRKPDEQYKRIEALVDGPYLELFARQPWPGWTAWGNQTDKFADPRTKPANDNDLPLFARSAA